ncbi:MAG: preprotein translocase subunit SecA [Candidatus Kerfeldbacteria bacterium]|nr:preprotein translocase subunit SecA [Candidatus Kerfeldbacteria bacterium]
MTILSKLFGDANARYLKQLEPLVDDINRRETDVRTLSDDQLRQRMTELRRTVGGERRRLDGVLVEVFAITREAARRTIGQRHYDVQLVGGLVLHQGKIAEMRTGEGKTLVATLPLTLNALASKGTHLVTVNDYLAKRDAGWMGAVYHALGLSCAAIVHEAAFQYDPTFENQTSVDPLLRHLRPISRAEAYRSDITYGTNNEFGFDYLRDNMAPEPEWLVQRELFFSIVDEVDSILIDEARTPLIISAPVEHSAEEYRRIDGLVRQLQEEQDYKVDEKQRTVFLTEAGIAALERQLGVPNLYASGSGDQLNVINQALRANSRLFQRDKQYVVRDGEVVIVDEFTGRLMFGRRYSEGLHQAIEAKEGVEVKQESQTLATVTFQNLFRMYRKLAGMTGTAATEAEEFHEIYNLDVVVVPTHRPMVRRDHEDSVYKNELGKFTAVVKDIRHRHQAGQPVLVGTISIAKNELLSAMLEREGVAHQVMNAKNHEREAQIIAQAGRRGAVTIATNMAGRGVDIILGGNPPDPAEHQRVLSLGGLHVIGTERHESRRIDLQLRGRAGRQGDPGSSQFYVSMEDDLMRIFGSDRMKRLMDRLGIPDDMPIENRMVSRSIESAQKKVEGHNFDIRKHLVEYDDVMNKHREVIYRKRREVLFAESDTILQLATDILTEAAERAVAFHTGHDEPSRWNLDELYDGLSGAMQRPWPIRRGIQEFSQAVPAGPGVAAVRSALTEFVSQQLRAQLDVLEKTFGDRQRFANFLRTVVLRSIDSLWIEHLDLMERLREGIGLRGYGQREPLVEYKREAYQLFTQLLSAINSHAAQSIFALAAAQSVAASPIAGRRLTTSGPAKTMSDSGPVASGGQSEPEAAPSTIRDVGRNDPCPCGSGKKFKKCYLANDPGCKLRAKAQPAA